MLLKFSNTVTTSYYAKICLEQLLLLHLLLAVPLRRLLGALRVRLLHAAHLAQALLVPLGLCRRRLLRQLTPPAHTGVRVVTVVRLPTLVLSFR